MHHLGSPEAKLNLKKYKHRQGEKEFPSEVALTFGQKSLLEAGLYDFPTNQ
jgi:hypothetical protein